jgi:glycosyltransferase involved in cell wall biosynthesis
MRQADAVLTHSSEEAILLESHLPKTKIHIVRWPVAIHPHKRGFFNRNGIGFIGSGDHAPNSDGLAWLIREIMPLVWNKNPDIYLHIAGSNWKKHLFANCDSRVILHGHVGDLQTFFSRLRLTVAPLRFGAGVKGKVLESFAAGVPCVMSKIASEGISIEPGLSQLVERDAFAFANKVIEIYHNKKLYEESRRAGLGLIRCQNKLAAIVEELERSITERISDTSSIYQFDNPIYTNSLSSRDNKTSSFIATDSETNHVQRIG